MKTNRLLLVGLLGAVVPGVVGAASAAPADLVVDVVFFEPENFTDIRESDISRTPRTGLLERLREHLGKQAARWLPPGYSLAVTFDDFDMAGEFEPWLGPDFSHIRIVKDIYPPSAKLHFRIVDSEGNVVKTGRRELRDTAFMMKVAIGSHSDPLRYERAMLDEWLRAELADLGGK